jgi:predicted nucleic acid-binding protein
MVLVDSSVVIDYLRSPDAEVKGLMVSTPAGICRVTRAEVLHGARSDADSLRLTKALDFLVAVAFPEEAWTQVGLNLSMLRRAGFKFPFPDVAIATLAIHLHMELWTRDKQFTLMQSVLPRLRLFVATAPQA